MYIPPANKPWRISDEREIMGGNEFLMIVASPANPATEPTRVIAYIPLGLKGEVTSKDLEEAQAIQQQIVKWSGG